MYVEYSEFFEMEMKRETEQKNLDARHSKLFKKSRLMLGQKTRVLPYQRRVVIHLTPSKPFALYKEPF